MDHATGETGRGIDAIRALMASERTGCLRVHVPGRGQAELYLLDGDLIAAITDEDAGSLVQRLVARGRIDSGAVARLTEGRGSVSMEQLEQKVDPTAVGRLMAGRFRDNLIFHLFDGGRFVFSGMDTVRVPHIQMGHDSAGLLRELEMVHGRISAWMDGQKTRMMSSGNETPASPQQRHIQALCTSGMRLDKLVDSSPFFPAQTLVLVAQMVEVGSLTSTAIEVDDGPKRGAIDHAIQVAAEEAARRSAVRDSGLSAFADHERDDRGLGKGEFTGGSDRVDLSVGTERAPGLRASAPALESTEVVRRIGVCNEVLQALVEAWDDQHGKGTGRRTVQLIVETPPTNCAPLFEHATVDSRGRIGATQLLNNLQRRPEAQRRKLVSRGLADLIDRALARGAEGLDDAHLDQMLTRVAGYRERLGW